MVIDHFHMVAKVSLATKEAMGCLINDDITRG